MKSGSRPRLEVSDRHAHQLKIHFGVGERMHFGRRNLVRGHQRALIRIVVYEKRLPAQVGGFGSGRSAPSGGFRAQHHVGGNPHASDPEIHDIRRRRAGIGSLCKCLFVKLRKSKSGQRSSQKESSSVRLHFQSPPDVCVMISLVSLSLHTDRGPAALLVLTLAALASALHGESRRAILVGIDNYNPDPATQAQLLRDLKPPAVKRPAVEGDAKYWRFDNLDGAVNDVHFMKAVLQSLGFQDFVVLTDQDATADAILQALQKNLVDDAQPGDFRLFYYSGHGNHVKNLASTKQQQEDQTLVPADNWRNVPDIRDKEISRILFAAARKGVIATFIADSCHSGSLARGAWNSSGKSRTNSGTRAGTPGVTLHELVANDPADTDPATHRPIDPEALGVLTLAAAQPNQEAREVQTEDGPHGAFTWAFAQALRYASEPVDRIFARTMASLGSNGALQQPAMGGASRFSKTIFGQPTAAGGGLTVVVDSVKGADIHLRGGTAIGLFPKCRLKTVSQPAVTLEIASSEGLSGSIARVVGPGIVKPGDVLTLDRWVVPAKAGLRVSVPKPAPEAAVARAVAEFGKLRGDPRSE